MKVFLKKKFNIVNFVILGLIIILLMLIFKKISVYFMLTFFTAFFTYVNYYVKLPFDISPVLFLSLIISREYSFILSAVFIILSGIIPMILAGGSFDHTTLFYLSIILVVCFMSSLLTRYPLYIVMIPLIILHHIIAYIGSVNFGSSPWKEFLNLLIKLGIDSFYLFTFGKTLISLIP